MELQELGLEEEEGRRERNGCWRAALYLALPHQVGWHSKGCQRGIRRVWDCHIGTAAAPHALAQQCISAVPGVLARAKS
jgi:hypothetical protein